MISAQEMNISYSWRSLASPGTHKLVYALFMWTAFPSVTLLKENLSNQMCSKRFIRIMHNVVYGLSGISLIPAGAVNVY